MAEPTPTYREPYASKPGNPGTPAPPPYGYAAPGFAGAYGPYSQATVGAARPQRRGWIVALVAVISVFVLLFFGLASCSGLAMRALSGSPLSADAGVATTESVGVITMAGSIGYDGSACSPEGLRTLLDTAENDPLIKAVVLRVNSGGGTATAGEEMAAYVRDFEKPIVVSSASMNASAAYEISSQADYIFTAKTSALGAIGTVMQLSDVSELLDKLGITIDNIASTDSKDSSYGTRPLTEEERAYYQAMVDQINRNFIETVAEGRSMSAKEVTALATGMTFTGIDAVENGLADEIGYYEDAVAKAAELAGIEHPETVKLQSGSSSITSILDLIDVLGESDAEPETQLEGIVQ